jgi:hypothetical protein
MTAGDHPGFISYVDGNSGKTLSTKPISTVPEHLRFADTPNGKVPVVKVVATVAGDQRTIREYGPGDVLLRSTVQLKGG